MEFSFKERYNYWYYSFRFTFDKEHGFGIEYGVQGQQESRRTFFEDASLVASSSEGDETVDSIKHMYGLADNSWRRSSAAEEKFIKDSGKDLSWETDLRDSDRKGTQPIHALASCRLQLQKRQLQPRQSRRYFCKEPSVRPDACLCRFDAACEQIPFS